MRLPRFRLRTILISIAFLALLMTNVLQAVSLQNSAVRQEMFRLEAEVARAQAMAQRDQAEAKRAQAEAALAQTESLLQQARSVRPTSASVPAPDSTREKNPSGR
jgi:hypothetical protein